MILLVIAAGGALVTAANLAGLWWVTLLAGAVAGLAAARARRALVAGAAAGLLGWGVPLAWMALQAPVGRTAWAIGAVLGLPAAVPAALPPLLGALLGLAGAWAAAASRALLAWPSLAEPSDRCRPAATPRTAPPPTRGDQLKERLIAIPGLDFLRRSRL